jgi:two-component system OmpR family sensor kinase
VSTVAAHVRPLPRVVPETGFVALAALASLLAGSVIVAPTTAANLHLALALAAAAAGAAAAIVADLSARLCDSPRVAWGGAALALYSLVVIPSTMLTPDGAALEAGLRAVRVVASGTVLVLLLLAVRPSRSGGIRGGWLIAAAGTVVSLIAGKLLALAPEAMARSVLDAALPTVTLGGGCWVAAVYLQQGQRLRRPPLWRIGIGLAVLAGAQTDWSAGGTSLSEPPLGFAALRLLGLVIVLVGVVSLWRSVLVEVRDDQECQAAQLEGAVERLRRAAASGARRDHELRNGITGLAGISALLSSEDEASRTLRSAVLAEIRRLDRMVEAGPSGPIGCTDVTAVLRETAALHLAGGHDVAVCAPDGLRAQIPDAVLRQILANLLVNARRHAPGAQVELRAQRSRTLLVVEVGDRGPGVPPGREEAVFDEGVRDDARGGSGLGLHIARDLASAHHGTLAIRQYDPQRPGCVAVLTFPVAGESRVARSAG